MQVFYSPAYSLAQHAFDTTRKAGWVAESLAQAPIPGLTIVPPEPLPEDTIRAVHDHAYVTAVHTGRPRALAESQGFGWDPGLWPMVLASNGGAVAAAETALKEGTAGSLSSGLHHARRGAGAGFCTFNGLVLAVRAARALGAAPLLILDLDAHCGGGTYSLVQDDPATWHCDLAVNPFDAYTPGPRATLDHVRDPAAYLPILESRLAALARSAPRFDLCLYNAGMDPYEGCPIGGLPGMTAAILAARERRVVGWCRERGVPLAFVLAGGYIGPHLDIPGLIALHRLTLAAAAA